MSEIHSIAKAIAQTSGPKLQLIHFLLHQFQSKDMVAMKAKTKWLKEEMVAYYNELISRAEKTQSDPEAGLQLDVFTSFSKWLKLPSTALSSPSRVSGRSFELSQKWFERAAKKDREVTERFQQSHIQDKLEFMLHTLYVQHIERFLKSEKAVEGKAPYQSHIKAFWEELPEYKRVQIYEHLKAGRNAAFEDLVTEFGTGRLLFEMGTRTGLQSYRLMMPPMHDGLEATAPDYMWVLHPDAVLPAEDTLKSMFSDSWAYSAAMLLLYEGPLNGQGEESSLSDEWLNQEELYRSTLRQINELKAEQQRLSDEAVQVQTEREAAAANETKAESVYKNLRERLIVVLKTDEARPYLGDVSVTNKRLREALVRAEEKLAATEQKGNVFQTAGNWMARLYWQNEKRNTETKLQQSFEQMADEVAEKYPYYEAELLEELEEAKTAKQSWSFEKNRLIKKEQSLQTAAADKKTAELALRQKAAEMVKRTPSLKLADFQEANTQSPIA